MQLCKNLFKTLLVTASAIATTTAQEAQHILSWKTSYTLNTLLLQRMHGQYAARQEAFSYALSSPQNLLIYQQQCRIKYKKLLGSIPAAVPLHAVTTGTVPREDYRIEKVIYESFPHHHITANLYIPSGKGPFPGVLLFCGHENESKATSSYQQTAILFARNGFEVLVVDPVSQGERYQLTNSNCIPSTRGGTTEHTLLNAAGNLFGSGTVTYELQDNVRSLDYLVSRPEVDTARVGCLGNSGGGMQTIYFAGYDNRIKIAAPCSYLATRDRTMELSGPADGCAQMPGEGAAQLEMNDYLISFAPKPLLILAGRYDFIDYTGTEQAYAELQRVYATLHKPEALSMFTFDDGHGISKPKREAAVQWFRKWFYNDDRPVHETTARLCSVQELNCTRTGQVCSEYPDEISIAEYNRKLYRSLNSARSYFRRNTPLQSFRDTLRSLLGLEPYTPHISAEETGIMHRQEYDIHNTILRAQDETPMPVQIIYPQLHAKKVLILLYDEGRQHISDSAAYISGLLQQGYAVIIPDLRGLGETSDLSSFNDPKYYNREYRNAMLALHIGCPLTGQRTKDIFTLLDFIQTDSLLKSLPTEAITTGSITGIAALHAAILDARISRLDIHHCINSFETILRHPEAKDAYSYIVPRALLFYDLPDLIPIAGKQRVKVFE